MSEQRRVDVPGVDAPDPDAPTEPSAVVSEDVRPGVHVRVFGSTAFFRLWLTQVISSIGDWLGFLAIAALAAGLPAAGSSAAAVGVVMSARIVPGFFLGAAYGVIADRFARKTVMVWFNVGRAAAIGRAACRVRVCQVV